MRLKADPPRPAATPPVEGILRAIRLKGDPPRPAATPPVEGNVKRETKGEIRLAEAVESAKPVQEIPSTGGVAARPGWVVPFAGGVAARPGWVNSNNGSDYPI